MRDEHRTRLTLYAGAPHDCPYLPGRTSLLHYVDPAVTPDSALFDRLLAHGFRRSGRYVYRPGCAHCQRCMAVRIPVASFAPDRSQRRAAQANADLETRVVPGSISDEHFDLYRRYLEGRHAGGGMDEPTPESCRDFLLTAGCETLLIELRLDGRLVATAVTDLLPTALSAVYTFFEPQMRTRGLGTFAVLQQVAEARRRGLAYLYLGYWVPESIKMDYKRRFRALEILEGNVWHAYDRHTELPVPD